MQVWAMLRFTPPEAFVPFAEAAKEEPPLGQSTFLQLRQFIYQLSGVWIADNRQYFLKARLARRLRALGLQRFEEYLRYVTGTDAAALREQQEMLNAIVVLESAFFRTPEHFEAIARTIVPELQRSGLPLRLWSAGCAAGEEPYSLAMVLHRYGMLSEQLELWGTDVSTDAITQAQRGRYPAATVRIPAEYEPYFVRYGPELEVIPELRQRVRFGVLNLVNTDAVHQMAPMGVILCRNVLLYFAPDVRRRVVQSLVDALVPGGYLFVGGTETLTGMDARLQLVHFPGALAYRRSEAGL
jgi:chemotaxis protein methyltransferase CheR